MSETFRFTNHSKIKVLLKDKGCCLPFLFINSLLSLRIPSTNFAWESPPNMSLHQIRSFGNIYCPVPTLKSTYFLQHNDLVGFQQGGCFFFQWVRVFVHPNKFPFKKHHAKTSKGNIVEGVELNLEMDLLIRV